MFEHNVQCVIWWKPNAYQIENVTQTVKHGGRELMMWAGFAATGLKKLIESTKREATCQTTEACFKSGRTAG